MNLDYLQKFVDEVNKTNSLNDKIATIEKWYKRDGVKLSLSLLPVYNFRVQYYVSSDNVKKNSGIVAPTAHKDFGTLLADLSTRKITGHSAIGAVNAFIKANPSHKDLILKVIDKDLEIRVDVSVINRACGSDIIPTFDVALAKKFQEATGKNTPNFDTQKWYASRKLDGCRMVVVVDEKGNVNAFSREGKPFETVGKALDDVRTLHLTNTVFDGEICLIKKDGSDDFQGIMKEIRKKDHTIQNVRYKIFDCLTLDEFNSKTSKRTLSQRLTALQKIATTFKNLAHLSMLDQWLVTDEEFAKRQAEAKQKGWEGLILRRDYEYKGKRSFDLLKCKDFFDNEYVVEGVKYDEFPYLQADGQFLKKNVVSCLVIKHKGYDVDVGSGLSQDERIEWKKDPKKIIGKTVSVQYFEETKNEKGGISLRFPTLKVVHGAKRTV